MPKPVTELSFTNWLREIGRLPYDIKDIAIKQYRVKGKENQLYLLFIKSASQAEGSGSVFLFSVSEQEFRELKGINTAVRIDNFVKNPAATLRALGEQTYKDITNIEEVADDRLASTIEALAEGKTTRYKKKGRY